MGVGVDYAGHSSGVPWFRINLCWGHLGRIWQGCPWGAACPPELQEEEDHHRVGHEDEGEGSGGDEADRRYREDKAEGEGDDLSVVP